MTTCTSSSRTDDGPVTADISAVSGYGCTATIYEYSEANKDVIVATPSVTAGRFTFTAPATGLMLAQVPKRRSLTWLLLLLLSSGLDELIRFR